MQASESNENDSFSSDSDDDFLTLREDGRKGGADREALVRKKLLESFYGKAADGAKGADSHDSEDSDDDGLDDRAKVPANAAEDLDSPHFDAEAHTVKHVVHSSVHDLLEKEEALACQVRTLDSSMQTLVYENYTRFIEATDAIKSIGSNVQANQEALATLSNGMNNVANTSKQLEDELGGIRDAVVEKLRLRRLLQRLDTLLNLPQTLRTGIAQGTYRQATRSYLQAHGILSKHSAGFESLQRIEVECSVILHDMLKDVRRKLYNWSGQVHMLSEEEQKALEQEENPPDLPVTVSEIFECSGALSMLLGASKESEQSGALDVGTTIPDARDMSLRASLRLVERMLDMHAIEWDQSLHSANSTSHLEDVPSDQPGVGNVEKAASFLVPENALQAIHETCILYGASFDDCKELEEFLQEAFALFLNHTRSCLLEYASKSSSESSIKFEDIDDESRKQEGAENEAKLEDDAEEEVFAGISAALSHVTELVRRLTSSLQSSDVLVRQPTVEALFPQVVDLTEAMIRRRVDQKFLVLRLHVIRDCLTPFCNRGAGDQTQQSETHRRVLDIVQNGGIALSDSLQLVDDTIRTVFATQANEEEASMLKTAVEKSTRRFAAWLASSLEQLAGFESSDPKITIDIKPFENTAEDKIKPSVGIATTQFGDDDSFLSIGDAPAPGTPSADDMLIQLCNTVGSNLPSRQRDEMTLAIAEMCRVAERSVFENISQSVATHSGSGRRKTKNMFPTNTGKAEELSSVVDRRVTNPMSERFILAASRIMALHSMNIGNDFASRVTSGLEELEVGFDNDTSEPRQEVIEVLKGIKTVSIDCADILGGSRFAGPPPQEIHDEFSMPSHSPVRSGLVFDVERMFAEKVIILPTTSFASDFTREAIVTTILKVVFKELLECCRMCKFSRAGCLQVMVDAEFFRFMLPHYVSDKFVSEGSNGVSVLEGLLSEVVAVVRQRTVGGRDEKSQSATINDARSMIRRFLNAKSGTEVVDSFTIS